MDRNAPDIRPPAVAGPFYPAQPERLREMVRGFMEHAVPAAAGLPHAIIAPHAGYPYSGPVAAVAYAQITAGREQIRRVVLLGPAHRVRVQGLAASSAAAWQTPLGDVALDQETIQTLLALPHVTIHDEAHVPEHGLEVQLPFLQTILDTFQLVPFVLGNAPAAAVAEVLHHFLDDPDTLLVISSDLSHYHPYEVAHRLDKATAQAIEALRPLAVGQACGRTPINGLLQLAREQGWRASTLDLRNSGDTAGPRDQVVGYGAFRFD